MKLIECPLSTEELYAIRRELHRVYMDKTMADHVHQGATVMLNYYGAVLDVRMEALCESGG